MTSVEPDLLVAHVPAHRVAALAGVMAGFIWPGSRSYKNLSRAQRVQAEFAAQLALSYLHEESTVTCHVDPAPPLQLLDGGEQVYMEPYQADALKFLDIAYHCPYCGPGANVWHLRPGKTMKDFRMVVKKPPEFCDECENPIRCMKERGCHREKP